MGYQSKLDPTLEAQLDYYQTYKDEWAILLAFKKNFPDLKAEVQGHVTHRKTASISFYKNSGPYGLMLRTGISLYENEPDYYFRIDLRAQ